MRVPVFEKVGEKRDHVREMRVEERHHGLVVVEVVQAVRTFERPKQRAGKRAVRVGQRHEHEGAARPNVQPVLFHLECAVGAGKHRDLLVAVGQVPVLEIEAVVPHHAAPDRAEGAVRPENAVDRHVQGLAVRLEVQGGPVRTGRVALAPVPKRKPNVGQRLGGLHENAVQARPGHGIDALAFEPVRLEGARAVDRVHAPATDGQGNFPNAIGHACDFERLPASVAQGEVDAPASVQGSFARVGSTLVDDHVVAAVAEHARPKAPDKTRTDDSHLTHGPPLLWPRPGPNRRSGPPRLRFPHSNESVRP